MEQPILNGLIAYNTEGSYPWHMPGHKRKMHTIFPDQVEDPFAIDVTEVEGLDEFHHPEGMIKEAFDRAAQIYGSDRSYYLVNGATCGILAAISAICKPGDTLIVARNCHASVYHAIRLLRLKAVYILPEWNASYDMFGGICVEEVKKAVKSHSYAKGVILVSPTYEGVVSDIEKIAKVVHKAKMPLIVDEAHGAHFEFISNVNETISTTNYKNIPYPAIRLGADLVIESLHKTLPAMTQCAILHMKDGLVKRERLEEFLSIYQSSSPSYVFMATMEACIEKMDHERDGQFIMYRQLIAEYRKRFSELEHIHLVDEKDFKKSGTYEYDKGKLVFSVKNCGILNEEQVVPFTGIMFGEILSKEYGQMMEMVSENYVIAMTSLADTREAFEGLYQALETIDEQLTNLSVSTDIINETKEQSSFVKIPEQKMTIAEGMDNPHDKVNLMDAAGRISGEYIYIYPPGIPIVAPGEIISREHVKRIQHALELHLNIKGVSVSDKSTDWKNTLVTVVRENRWLTRTRLFSER